MSSTDRHAKWIGLQGTSKWRTSVPGHLDVMLMSVGQYGHVPGRKILAFHHTNVTKWPVYQFQGPQFLPDLFAMYGQMTGFTARSFWCYVNGARNIWACTRLEKVSVTPPKCPEMTSLSISWTAVLTQLACNVLPNDGRHRPVILMLCKWRSEYMGVHQVGKA